jgi:hypothetical protein
MLVEIDRSIRHRPHLVCHCRPSRGRTTAQLSADQRPGGAFLGGNAATLDGAAAGFFLLVDFGFFASRLLRFCPLANPVLPCDQ